MGKYPLKGENKKINNVRKQNKKEEIGRGAVARMEKKRSRGLKCKRRGHEEKSYSTCSHNQHYHILTTQRFNSIDVPRI